MSKLDKRLQLALRVGTAAAKIAAGHFAAIDSLTVEKKGQQDLVSNADREVEQYIRKNLLLEFADDGIVGEEYDNVESASGYTWVIDPIDGTASFVVGRPGWCVVIACVSEGKTVLGVVIDPVAGETFRATLDGGAYLNDRIIKVSDSKSLAEGSVGTGYCNRFPATLVTNLLQRLLTEENGVFYQNASGALMLVYVASGRLIGYTEAHMNPWDCMAALLIIEEAGGVVQVRDQQRMLRVGERVVAACPGVYDRLAELSDDAFGDFRIDG